MDFTIKTYRLLLGSLLKNGYTFLPFKEYIQSNHSVIQLYNESRQSEAKTDLSRCNEVKTDQSINNHHSSIIILRHDVDRQPDNALEMAKLEKELGIEVTYYFRIVAESFNEQIIRAIAELGHEIGYHYEDVDLVLKSRDNGITEKWNIVNKSMKEKDNYFKGDINIPKFQNSK